MSQTTPFALLQTFQKQQAQQKGNPQRAEEVVQTLLQKAEIREMLVRLRDK